MEKTEKITYFSKIDGISLERMERKGKFDMRIQHFHKEYEIFYLIDGDRHFFFNNRAYLAKGGSLILVDSNLIHMTRSINETEKGHDRIILYIDKPKMQQFDAKYPSLNLIQFFKDNYGIYDLSNSQKEQFMSMYKNLQEELEHKARNYEIMVEAEIIRYFIKFMRETHNASPVADQFKSVKNNKVHTIYEVAEYITEHFDEEIALDTLAQKFYLSKFYLSRTFKEVTGTGINEYVNILRMKKAARLLEETNLTISQIANEVGYGSVTYFEKVFKVFMTISPLKYRKTLDIVTYTNTPNP